MLNQKICTMKNSIFYFFVAIMCLLPVVTKIFDGSPIFKILDIIFIIFGIILVIASIMSFVNRNNKKETY